MVSPCDLSWRYEQPAGRDDTNVVPLNPARSYLLAQFATAAATIALAAALIWLAIVDLRELRLPDVGTIALLAGGVAYRTLISGPPIWVFVAGACIGYLGFWALAEGYLRKFGRPGLGLGDAKLLAAVGAWLGPLGLAPVIATSSLLALGYVGVRWLSGRPVVQGTPVPFGPFIAAAFFMIWCFAYAPFNGVQTWRN